MKDALGYLMSLRSTIGRIRNIEISGLQLGDFCGHYEVLYAAAPQNELVFPTISYPILPLVILGWPPLFTYYLSLCCSAAL